MYALSFVTSQDHIDSFAQSLALLDEVVVDQDFYYPLLDPH